VASNRRFAVWENGWKVRTANKLGDRIKQLGISYDRIATDNGDSFLSAYSKDLLFFKEKFNHRKTFEMAFFCIIYGFV
jgi:hypothetical protein